MNQTCQRFSGGPQHSRTPSAIFIDVVFVLDLGFVRLRARLPGGHNGLTTVRQE